MPNDVTIDELIGMPEVCTLLRIGVAGLRKRLYLGRAPRPVHGRGARALWRKSDLVNWRGYDPTGAGVRGAGRARRRLS